jgi:hypothetical protein
VTVDDWLAAADRVEATRELSSWQRADLALYRTVVRRQGRVMELDEYYLTIVGVPPRGYVVMLKPRPKRAEQARLF